MAKIIVALFALVFHLCAHSQTVGLHLVSAHQHGGMSGVNPGLYARFDSGATIGVYRNSFERQSFYAGWTFETPKSNDVSVALTIGAVTGYGKHVVSETCGGTKCTTTMRGGADVQPLLIPSISYGFARLGIVPAPGSQMTALHLMAEHRF